ncbi:MAG: SGNH/GDSL hydrolase family protein [Deltaproteobacteria bacterium]|nr:SGNH/GDSL hydrolase family protein [Deltaproteobacteria bacterium]
MNGFFSRSAVREDRFTIVCFGDSITNGYGVRRPWRQVMARQLAEQRPDLPLRVINSGVDGDTLFGGRHRLRRDVLRYRPQITTIAFGLNDLAMGAPLAEFRDNLEKVVAALVEIACQPVLLTTVRPAGDWFFSGSPEDYNRQMLAVAERRRLPLLDLWREWPALEDPYEFFLADGVHPSEAGHAFIGRRTAAFLAPLLPAPDAS